MTMTSTNKEFQYSMLLISSMTLTMTHTSLYILLRPCKQFVRFVFRI